MKSVVRRTLRHFGAEIVRYPREPEPLDPRSFTMRRGRWLTHLGITVLLDVGANVGQYGAEARRRGYSGRIVSFEPQTAAFEKLERITGGDSNWQCHNLALGAIESRAEINIAGNSESSSLLPMEQRHIEAYPASAYVGKETVRVVRLDSLTQDLLKHDDVVWLKMDVQGYEMSVLEGAERALGQIQAIEMELSVEPLYGGGSLFCETIEALKRMDYHLIAIEEAFLDGTTAHALQLNGIFERRR